MARPRTRRPRLRRGLTLLEVMVALVILGIVATSLLELVGGSVRTTGIAHDWSRAVSYAEETMERLKLGGLEPAALTTPQTLPGGFTRRIRTEPWRGDIVRVTVVVSLPNGGTFDLTRLVRTTP